MSQIVIFHGTSHRAGCTMIAQSAAELAAREKKELSVLFAALNGRKSSEYMSEDSASVDDFKIELKSGIGVDKSALNQSKRIDNMYVILGIGREEEVRSFLPEMAETLIHGLSEKFDLIIIDSGSVLDNGLAYGALKLKGLKYLIMEQTESSIARYEKMRPYYDKLDIGFDKYILSKYCPEDPLTENYISSRLSINKSLFFEIGYQDKGRVSEIEYKTLLETGQDRYRADIAKITNVVMKEMNLEDIPLKRKRSWNNFI